MLLSVALQKCHTGAVNSYTGKQITTGLGCFACGFPENKETKPQNTNSLCIAFDFVQGIHLADSNDKFTSQFLSNISRNSNCFLFFPFDSLQTVMAITFPACATPEISFIRTGK